MDRVEFAFEPSGFQQWANENDVSAIPEADHNSNGVPDLIDFVAGGKEFSRLHSTGTVDFVTCNEAYFANYLPDIFCSKDLINWMDASVTLPDGVTFDSMFIDRDDNYIKRYKIDDSSDPLFWRIEVAQ